MFSLKSILNRGKKARTVHTIKLEGIVRVYQGDKLLFEAKNRIVSQGLKAILLYLGCVTATQEPASYYFDINVGHSRIRLGRDTTTPTYEGTTSLADEIEVDRDTASVSIQRVSAGVYEVIWYSTWNAGRITEQVGEMGLYLKLAEIDDASLPVTDYAWPDPTALTLFSRLSVADGDFEAFTPDPSLPLTIAWTLRLSF